MTRRWRPSLSLVLGGALVGTLVLSLVGLVALRYLGPEIGFRNAALLLGGVITAATAVLGWLLVRLLLGPIRALEAFAAAQERMEHAPQPAHFGTRELHSTGQQVIAMAHALRDREATVRAYTDHVTHELKTPVAAIRAAVELMEDGQSLAPADQQLLTQIDGARLQLEAQLAALRAMARAREARYLGQATVTSVLPDLRATHSLLRLEAEGPEVLFPLSCEGLTLVMDHLLHNAAEHGASVVVLLSEAGRLTVEDNGSGVAPADAARIFEPFYTTKRETGGTGMGLSVARALLQAHGADIHCNPGASGARFILTFPG